FPTGGYRTPIAWRFWTEGDCLGGYRLAPASLGHLSVSQGSTISDLPAARGEILPQVLAIRTRS
ncbi:MAG: hypothetical protein HC778_07585, partial [Chamaesiphon sp. CSU_1_12]|nr:hypothetical protein [Chamaesiphon sp. CSU_1_12]